jgi:ferredoxin-NADP reductase
LSFTKVLTHNTVLIKFAGNISAVVGPGMHLSLREPSSGKTRPYSPTQCQSDNFFIAVKKYDLGIVSSYVHALRVGDWCEMKGPVGSFNMNIISHHHNDTWLFLAAGSGVTPVFAVLRECVANNRGADRLLLLLSNSSNNDVMLGDELNELQEMSRGRLVVKHVLSREQGRLTAQVAKKKMGNDKKFETECFCFGQILGHFVEEKSENKHHISFVGLCGPVGYCERAVELLTQQQERWKNVRFAPPKNETFWKF